MRCSPVTFAHSETHETDVRDFKTKRNKEEGYSRSTVFGRLRLFGFENRNMPGHSGTDPFSGLTQFLVLKKTYQSEFSKKWQQFENHVTNCSVKDGRTDKSGDGGKIGDKSKADDKGKDGDKGKADNKGKDGDKNTDDDKKKDGDKAKGGSGGKTGDKEKAGKGGNPQKQSDDVKAANLLKARLLKHRVAAQNLVQMIHSDKSYKWADNDANVGSLEDKLAVLEGSLTGPIREFLVQDMKVMADKYTKQWPAELQNFRKSEKLLENVVTETKRLMAGHKIQMQFKSS